MSNLLLKKYHLFAESAAGPTVSALANGDSNSVTDFINSECSVGVKFDTDGEEYEYNPNGTFTSTVGTWLDSGSASDVWVSFTRTSGSRTVFIGKTDATRYQISTDQAFRIEDADNGAGGQNILGVFKFYDAATGGNLLQTTSSANWFCNLTEQSCPLCCFTPDTPILMADGKTMPIGDIRKGDLIRVENGIEPVTEVLTRERRAMYAVLFEDGRALRMSDDHPIYVEGKGWCAINPVVEYKDLGMAKTLLVGDHGLGSDGRDNKIISMMQIEYPDTVYTFANSGFFANGMLVY